MSMINKPFYNSLHYPSLMPFQKEKSELQPTKIPSLHVNTEVFDRLYGHAMVDNYSKTALRALQASPPTNLVYLNQNTGQLEADAKLQNQFAEIYGESRKGSAKGAPVSAKLKTEEAAKDAKLIKPRNNAYTNVAPKILTRSSLG